MTSYVDMWIALTYIEAVNLFEAGWTFKKYNLNGTYTMLR